MVCLSNKVSEKMLKRWSALLLISVFVAGATGQPGLLRDDQQLTDLEEREAQDLVIRFTTRFMETTDLGPLMAEMYVEDFIDRYKKDRIKGLPPNGLPDVYFVPGLDYNSRLLTEANSQEWRRLHRAANNFIFFGFASGFQNMLSRDGKDIKTTDFYPESVLKLLSRNANLANMVVRKERPKALSTPKEMNDASATLEEAVAIIRRKHHGKFVLDIKLLTRLIKEDELFKPRLEVSDDELFAFPPGTRLIFIQSPLAFRLILVKADGKLRILWSEPGIDE